MPHPGAALALALLLAAPPAAAGELLFHADLDGQIAVPACGRLPARPGERSPDLARLAQLVRSRRGPADEAPVLLLGGNIAAPGLFGRALLADELTGTGTGLLPGSGATLLAEALARTGYDAVTLGHHDLSLPPGDRHRLLAALARQPIPVVASNLRCQPAQRSLCAATVKQTLVVRGEERIGVVAALSPLVLPGLGRASREGLTLDSAGPALASATRDLRRRGATRVVALVQGPRSPEWLAELVAWQRQLATAPSADAPDVLLAGGLGAEAAALRLIERDIGPAIVASSDGAAAVVRVSGEDQRGRARGQARVQARVEVLALDPSAPPDLELEGRLQRARTAYCARYARPIAGPAGPARLGRRIDREEFLRYLLAVLRRHTGAEIALVNRDFVKQSAFPLQGTLTRADLLHAMPYPDPAGRARVTGAAVASALGPALANPRLAALGLERDAAGNLTVNGRPLDRARHYTVASNVFLAAGGDGILPGDLLPSRPDPGAPQLRALVEQQLAGETGREDGDPSVDPRTDFGAPASARPLLVGLFDLSLDASSVTVRPQTGYQAPQLTRAEQRALKANLALLAQLRSLHHEADGRLKLLYGAARTRTADGATVTGETADLVLLSTLYNFRGLRRGGTAPPSPLVPDPYARLQLESELTLPDATTPESRRYHHAELTATAGVLFTLAPPLRVRGGPGVRQQLLADGAAGQARFLLEAGATLDPIALASFGPLQARLEGLADYSLLEPTGLGEHQLRTSAKLAFPLLPLLYLTAGVDLFAMKRAAAGWGLATDTTIGLRLHLDAAHQRL